MAPTATLKIKFEHQFKGQPLELNTNYQNDFGEAFSIGRFKYYISNIVLYRGSNASVLPETYFLIDENDTASKTLRIPIAAGNYDQMHLLLGVDSARNVSGAQTGALDPLNDMFWTWNTGYIMVKLEGSSPLSTQPNNRIQYHIGGFSGAYSALRQMETGFPSSVEVKSGQTLTVTFNADLQRWFNGVHDLPIAGQTVAMTPGPLSARYADNAVSMFSVKDARVQ
ncbi:MbnP family protein [Cnuella takakiae]|nr:MbnP family protein [Cnuella takakiae]